MTQSSCATFTSTPVERRLVTSECRKLCQPMILSVMPASTSAGRITFFSRVSGESGVVPFRRIEGNTKSSSPWYNEVRRQSLRTTQTEPCRGMGFPLALVFTLPNRLRTTLSVRVICMASMLTFDHLRANISDRRSPVDPTSIPAPFRATVDVGGVTGTLLAIGHPVPVAEWMSTEP